MVCRRDVAGAYGGRSGLGGLPDTTQPTPMVEGIQRELAVNGFDPGGIDGRFGPKTSEAIRAYQRAAKLSVTGCPSQELLDHVSFHLPKVYSRARPASSYPEVEVQEGLTMRGFYVGAVDGRIGDRDAGSHPPVPARSQPAC